ncbi:phosphate acyltransferase PlsX [Alkalilimnicola sp. S0819]|uniref:phosphate acyltransferase PlsX n=1 Tax=Alkalilimnicola sp. S0819 TaxID=2613922 RepID=UPI001261D517|nr:phosphate acyltransferase PlsX [Alkalilimnicola sp. S0819]KAB7627620.1 phosphate acyltransferase PlsX [Alkalilimnicola sp. S0819]MPQ15782.1 phosphate acyltransferase PlsX [Alkalilimnicola sp. S0819]
MSRSVTIALDAMGGDHGPAVVVPAALDVLRRHPRARLILVGQEEALREELARHPAADEQRLSIHHASQTVEMGDPPSQALRMKKDSSMRVSLNLVKEGQADAVVSAGNTGALMATARFVLKTLPGIDRPAIITAIPCQGGYTRVLDLGANVDCSAEHLFQFGVMGSVLAEAVDGIDRPRIGLLNIGEEEIKGNDQVKQAAQMLSGSDLNYLGYVEADQIFKGAADVVVCDGFVGNVSLKTMEGVASLIKQYLKDAFTRNLLTKAAALAAAPVLKALAKRIDHRQYNGASLLGLRGIVLKSHGGADAFAFGRAIDAAIVEVDKAVPSRIDQRLDALLSERRPS